KTFVAHVVYPMSSSKEREFGAPIYSPIRSPRRSSFPKARLDHLTSHETGKQSVLTGQFVKPAGLNDATAVDHIDSVRALNGAQPVRGWDGRHFEFSQ